MQVNDPTVMTHVHIPPTARRVPVRILVRDNQLLCHPGEFPRPAVFYPCPAMQEWIAQSRLWLHHSMQFRWRRNTLAIVFLSCLYIMYLTTPFLDVKDCTVCLYLSEKQQREIASCVNHVQKWWQKCQPRFLCKEKLDVPVYEGMISLCYQAKIARYFKRKLFRWSHYFP